MKKILILVCAFLLALSMLCACGDEQIDASSQVESASSEAASSEEISEQISQIEENSETPEPEDSVKLLFARFTEKPEFVMIGTCAQGATVTATIGEQEVTVPSYMGWFTVTMKSSNSTTQRVTFSQTVDGQAYDVPRTYTATIRTPEFLGTTAFASNEAYQFFLAQMVPDFEGGNLFSQSNIDGMKKRIQTRLAQLQSLNEGAEIIYMIIPSPMTIYPELVPDKYTQTTGTTRFDQVTTAMREAGATVIDVRDVFMEHKNDEMPLYYHLDSHWADYGAYLAYEQLFAHIAKDFPAAAPRPIDDFTWTADYYTSADAMLYLGITQSKVKEYGYYREFAFDDPANITSVPRYRGMQLIYNDMTTLEKVFYTKQDDLPSCVVYRDSYSAAIYDLIPERMNKTHYMGMWTYGWNNAVMQNEKPDYVIYITSEWNMFQCVNN